MKAARERCHRDFRQCAREILDGGLGQVERSFGDEAATSFFSEVYHSTPWNFVQPGWMPTPSPPEVELDCSQFSESELARVIKRMKAQSAPSPFDRVGYILFKKCPSLLPAPVTYSTPAGLSRSSLGSGSVLPSNLSPRAQPQRILPTRATSDQLP